MARPITHADYMTLMGQQPMAQQLTSGAALENLIAANFAPPAAHSYGLGSPVPQSDVNTWSVQQRQAPSPIKHEQGPDVRKMLKALLDQQTQWTKP